MCWLAFLVLGANSNGNGNGNADGTAGNATTTNGAKNPQILVYFLLASVIANACKEILWEG